MVADMVYAPSSPDYRRAIRATYLWAAVTPWIASCVALPFVLAAPVYLAFTPWDQVSISGVVSSLLASALGVFGWCVALRCIVRSVARVRRSPGYPDRHWSFLRREFRSLMLCELAMLAFGSAVTAIAFLGPERIAHLARPLSVIVIIVIVYAQLAVILAPGDWLQHATVVPYFPSRVGELETFGSGESVARHVAELDEVANSLGLMPLSSFGWNDDVYGEPLVWHESATGLKTVNALLAYLEAEEFAWADHAEIIADLKRIGHALERADARGIPFSLLLRHATMTNQAEWDARAGTCF